MRDCDCQPEIDTLEIRLAAAERERDEARAEAEKWRQEACPVLGAEAEREALRARIAALEGALRHALGHANVTCDECDRARRALDGKS